MSPTIQISSRKVTLNLHLDVNNFDFKKLAYHLFNT